MRSLAVLALLAGCGSGSSTPPPTHDEPTVAKPVMPARLTRAATDVRVDRRIELVSIVQRLSGAPEYTQAPHTPYLAAVDAWFKPFAAHPAIAATRKLRADHGISYDAPMILAVHLDANLAIVSHDELAVLDPRWTGVDTAGYAAALRDFAEVTKLDDFLVANAPYHRKVATTLRTFIDAENPVGWFDELFGARTKARYVVVPCAVNGPASYGVRAMLPDGTLEIYQLIGIEQATGMPATDDDSIGLVIHEMAHSYINPLFARHRAALEPAGTKLYPHVEQAMRAQAYATWDTMLNESGVRATTVLYLRERKGDIAGATAARGEIRRSFLWITELTEVLRRYRRDRASYGSFDAYMPKVIEFFEGVAAQYAHGLPPIPFLGPVNAVIERDPVWVLPASPDKQVTGYAAGIATRFAPRAPQVVASTRTLTEQAGHNLVAYGSATTNPVIAEVIAAGGWKVGRQEITLGTRTFTGEHLVLIACRFLRDDPAHGIAVYTAADERDLIDINSVRHGGQDWLVARKHPGGAFEVLDSGDWPHAADGAWLLP